MTIDLSDFKLTPLPSRETPPYASADPSTDLRLLLAGTDWSEPGGRVRQRGVISGVPPGRIVQAALGVICSGVTSSICGVERAAMPSICM